MDVKNKKTETNQVSEQNRKRHDSASKSDPHRSKTNSLIVVAILLLIAFGTLAFDIAFSGDLSAGLMNDYPLNPQSLRYTTDGTLTLEDAYISSGDYASAEATEQILIKAPFHAYSGSSFHAKHGECGIPDYEPEVWNSMYVASNNCYNYANNKATGTTAAPGKASECNYYVDGGVTCDSLADCMVEDGLVLIDDQADPCPTNNAKIAYSVHWNEEGPFHFYRKDSNGDWSHKPGNLAVTNEDKDSEVIGPDLEDTDVNLGTNIFCGYACACSSPNQQEGLEAIY